MKLHIKKGQTSKSVVIFIQDSSVTTGAGKTGLVFNSAGLVAYYVRNRGTATAITLATLTNPDSAYSSGGFKEIDATNMPGVYRFDIPDAALATGVDDVVIMLKGATNMAPVAIEIQLVTYDPNSAGLEGQLADSVPADGTRPTAAQALYMITQFLLERSVSGTTMTVKKVDGATTLMTFTLNDATSPTSITRAT